MLEIDLREMDLCGRRSCRMIPLMMTMRILVRTMLFLISGPPLRLRRHHPSRNESSCQLQEGAQFLTESILAALHREFWHPAAAQSPPPKKPPRVLTAAR